MKEVIAFDEMTYQDNEDYKLFLESIKYSFRNTLKMGHNHLFTTDANGLYDTFLDGLPAESRQIYNCNACRHFVNKFGGLVVIDENTGEQTPAMWNTNMNMEESVFHKAALRLCDKVKRSKVTGVFVTSGKTLGTPATGCWIHMATRVPDEAIYRSRIKTPHQVMAEKAEEDAKKAGSMAQKAADKTGGVIDRAADKAEEMAKKAADKVSEAADKAAEKFNQK